MHTQVNKTKDNKNHPAANSLTPNNGRSDATQLKVSKIFGLDLPEVQQLKALQEIANNSSQVKQLSAFQSIANNSPHVEGSTLLTENRNDNSSLDVQKQAFNEFMPVQRAVTLQAGQTNQVRNVANAAMGVRSGPKPDASYGLTPSIFNGHEYPPRSEDQLLLDYTITTNKDDNDMYSDVVNVPNQIVSWLMEIPTNGPWVGTRQFPVDRVIATIGDFIDVPADHPIRALEGNVTVHTVGDPDSGTLVNKIMAHENKHVKNTVDVVNEILRPWDLGLQAYADELGDKKAADPLTMALGLKSKPPENTKSVSTRIAKEIKARDLAYHASPNGRDPKIVGFSLKNTTVTLKLRLDST